MHTYMFMSTDAADIRMIRHTDARKLRAHVSCMVVEAFVRECLNGSDGATNASKNGFVIVTLFWNTAMLITIVLVNAIAHPPRLLGCTEREAPILVELIEWVGAGVGDRGGA